MPAEFPLNTTNQLVQLVSQNIHPNAVALAEANHQIQNLLQQFNLGVQASFTLGGMQDMKHLTTPAGYQIMQKKYTTWVSRQIVALKLVSCEFLAFNLLENGSRARAWTFEKWLFVYADGRAVPTSGSVDGYDLQNVDGQWRVISAKTYTAEAD